MLLLEGAAPPNQPCHGVPPLHAAAGLADGGVATHVIGSLAAAGAAVDAAGRRDGTALHAAVLNPHLYFPPRVRDAAGPQGVPRLRTKLSAGAAAAAALLAAGADPSVPAAGGLQPLHVCAASSTQPAAAAAVVQALVAGGADPDALDAAGLTPLHHALRNPSAGPALIQALVESGASARPLLERLGGRRR